MPHQADCKTPLDPNFAETIRLLNAHDVPYWVCHGTLLGLVRDGELIPWDHDIDIAIWAGAFSKESLIDLMTASSYALKSDGADYDFVSFVKPGGREVDFNYYRTSGGAETAYSEWFISRSRVSNFLEILSSKAQYDGRWSWLVRRLRFLSPLASFLVRSLKRRGIFYKSAGYTTPAHMLREFE